MKKIGEGIFAICYLLEDGKTVRKYYKGDMPRSILKTLGIKNGTFIFSTKADFDNKYADMLYVTGLPFIMFEPDCSCVCIADPLIKHFISSMPKVYEDARIISKDGIRINDMAPNNILISIDEGIKVIDTDLYLRFDEDTTDVNIYEVNKSFNDCIFFPLSQDGEYDHDLLVEELVMTSINEKLKKLYDLALSEEKGNDCYIEFLKELIKYLGVGTYGTTIKDIRVKAMERIRQ